MTDAIPTPPPAEFDEMDERKAFEALRSLFGRGYTVSNGWFDRWPDGNYKRIETQAAWEGWCSARRLSHAEISALRAEKIRSGRNT